MNGMSETLGIQWQMLLVQFIDFAIALVVLWKFAYKPIFKVLDARKAKIADAFNSAEKIKADIAKTEVDRQKVLAEAGDKANRLIDDAREAAARVREIETKKAIAEAEQIVAKAREAAAHERVQMLNDLKREIGRLVVQTTTTVTGKILTLEDQQRLARETEKQLAS